MAGVNSPIQQPPQQRGLHPDRALQAKLLATKAADAAFIDVKLCLEDTRDTSELILDRARDTSELVSLELADASR